MYVLRDGQVVGELSNQEIKQEIITNAIAEGE